MYTFAIVAVITMLVIIVKWWPDFVRHIRYKEFGEAAFVVFAVAIVGGFVSMFIGFLIASMIPNGREINFSPHVTNTIKSVAMQDGQATNVSWGWFIFTSITSEGAQRYFYAEQKDGYKTVNFIEGVGDSIRIYEEDRGDGEIRTVVLRADVKDNEFKWSIPPNDKTGWTEIHVPKWTVKTGYSVDLK